MTRDELERRIKHWQIYGEEPDLMTAKLVHDMKHAYLRLHLDHQQTRQDLRELEKEKARLITLTQMQDEFITEKSGLAAERLAEVNRLAFELQTFKDGLEEETHG